jgi:hypothetical protein
MQQLNNSLIVKRIQTQSADPTEKILPLVASAGKFWWPN